MSDVEVVASDVLPRYLLSSIVGLKDAENRWNSIDTELNDPTRNGNVEDQELDL